MGAFTLSTAAGDVATVLSFFTRLPAGAPAHGARPFAHALWAAPVAGIVVGLIGAATYALADAASLPPGAAALLALAATLLSTGCLHEDGLSDVADGFGGGATRERKLEIMRDSRIGTYGAAALFLSLGLRWAALASLGAPQIVLWAMVGAHGASRALLPAFLAVVPPARPGGLGAGVGPIPGSAVRLALLIGALCLVPLGAAATGTAVVLLALWFAVLRSLALRSVGGQTGDVCGALQQGGEIAVLLVASAVLTHP